MTLLACHAPALPHFKRLGLVGKPAHTLGTEGKAALSEIAAWLGAHCESLWVETHTAAALGKIGRAHV